MGCVCVCVYVCVHAPARKGDSHIFVPLHKSFLDPSLQSKHAYVPALDLLLELDNADPASTICPFYGTSNRISDCFIIGMQSTCCCVKNYFRIFFPPQFGSINCANQFVRELYERITFPMFYTRQATGHTDLGDVTMDSWKNWLICHS